VRGKRSRTIGIAGWFVKRIESPKSPKRAPPSGRSVVWIGPLP
jgi:hypothetical protein